MLLALGEAAAAPCGDGEQGAGSVHGAGCRCQGEDPWMQGVGRAGAGPCSQVASQGLPAGLAPALQKAPGRCFGVTDCGESCSPRMVTKGPFWETTGGFAFFSLFHLTFCHDGGQAGHRLEGGAPQKCPSSQSMQETPQPSPRHHRRGFGLENHQLLFWKDPKASLELKCAPASSWSLEPSHSCRCLGNISNAIRKRVAKQQR